MVDRERRALRKQLLRGGVAPKHVKRILRELENHYSDLKDNALAEGLSEEDAARRAKTLLGDRRLIAEEALAQPELKSWSHRFAWAVYGLGPVAVLVAIVVSYTLALAGVLSVLEARSGLTPAEFAWQLSQSTAARIVLETWRVFNLYVLPTAVAIGLCLFAARREARILWPIVGVLLISFLGYSYNFQVTWPEAPGPEELASIGAGIGLHHPIAPRTFRFVIPVLLTLGPYLWWRAYSRHQPD